MYQMILMQSFHLKKKAILLMELLGTKLFFCNGTLGLHAHIYEWCPKDISLLDANAAVLTLYAKTLKDQTRNSLKQQMN